MTTTEITRAEVMPEDWSDYYPDTGCRYFPSCLNCPLPECLYDNPEAVSQYREQLRRQQDQSMVDEIVRDGLTTKQAAERFQVTPRTILRVFQRSREYARETA